MELAFQVCSYLLWFPLEILAISAVLRSGVRRYPLVFTYLVATFLAAVAQVPALLAYYPSRPNGALYLRLWWAEEFVTDVLSLAVVLGLIYGASSGLAARRTVRRALALGAVLFIGISFLVHHQNTTQIGLWMAPWTRDINFCAAILDLALWAMLIAKKKPDWRLLMLSGGMGMMFCGWAIGESVRTVAIHYQSHAIVLAGNVIEQLTNLIFLYVWWQTFRRDAAERSLAPAAVLQD